MFSLFIPVSCNLMFASSVNIINFIVRNLLSKPSKSSFYLYSLTYEYNIVEYNHISIENIHFSLPHNTKSNTRFIFNYQKLSFYSDSWENNTLQLKKQAKNLTQYYYKRRKKKKRKGTIRAYILTQNPRKEQYTQESNGEVKQSKQQNAEPTIILFVVTEGKVLNFQIPCVV